MRKHWQAGGVIQFPTDTPPNPTSLPPSLKKWTVPKLTAAQTEPLRDITDALQYSCGAPLIPEDHELSGVFVVRQDVSCDDPVDKLYYSCRKFEEISTWCDALEPEARIKDKTRAIYKVVNPVCQECAAVARRGGWQTAGTNKVTLLKCFPITRLSRRRVSVLCSWSMNWKLKICKAKNCFICLRMCHCLLRERDI